MELAVMWITWKPVVIAATVVLILVRYQCSNLTYPSKSLSVDAVTRSSLSVSQCLRKSKKKTECLCRCCFAMMKG